MAAEPKEQPVLLTEGTFVQDDAENPSQNPSVPPASNDETAEPRDNLTQKSAVTPPADPRPVTAPEGSVGAGLGSAEPCESRAMTSARSMTPKSDAGDNFSETLNRVPSEAGDGDQVEYVAAPEDPYMRALTYMEKHKVMQIFQKLTAEIVYHRPPDPLDYMLVELQKMKKERDARIDAIISSASSKSKSKSGI